MFFRRSIGGKFVPTGRKIHFIVGQDLDCVREFVKEVMPSPSGTTTYTKITPNDDHLAGVEQIVDYGAGPICAEEQIKLVPNSVLAIGLDLVDALGAIASHRRDQSIDRLGKWIKAKNRPVFLRIGYEFDGAHNHYDPNLYKQAFRVITERLRNNGVTNFATVWQSDTHGGSDKRFMDWYPGDDVVDWMAFSLFDFNYKEKDAMLALARKKKKPFMIAEAAPRGIDMERSVRINRETNRDLEAFPSGGSIWKTWYQPFFKYIYKNSDVIRAVAYINCPWKKQSMWNSGKNGYWGDTRVQMSSEVKKNFLKEISNKSLWLHASPNLDREIQM